MHKALRQECLPAQLTHLDELEFFSANLLPNEGNSNRALSALEEFDSAS